MIPKIVWQTHECKYEDLPEMYKDNAETWKFDGWDYRYHSASQRKRFIEKHFPEYLYIYENIKFGIYKADFWRLLVLYKFGGLYADIDSRHLNHHIDDAKEYLESESSFIIPSNFLPDGYPNGWIMSTRRNRLLKEIILGVVDLCKDRIEHSPLDINAYETGPSAITKILNNTKKDFQVSFFHVNHQKTTKYLFPIMPDTDEKSVWVDKDVCSSYIVKD